MPIEKIRVDLIRYLEKNPVIYPGNMQRIPRPMKKKGNKRKINKKQLFINGGASAFHNQMRKKKDESIPQSNAEEERPNKEKQEKRERYKASVDPRLSWGFMRKSVFFYIPN